MRKRKAFPIFVLQTKLLHRMEGAYIYHKYVTGKNFVGRRNESQILSNLLSQGENVVMYEPPRTGQMSLIQQTLMNMRLTGSQFGVAEMNLLPLRSVEDFLLELCCTVLRTAASSPDEFMALAAKHLEGTCVRFDEALFEMGGRPMSADDDPGEEDIRAVLALPWKIAEERGEPLIVIIREFQNIMLTEDGDGICRKLEETMRSMPDERRRKCRFIFSGSCVNAMKDIFEVHGRFRRLVERVQLLRIDDKSLIEHIVRGFLSGGKVIDRELLIGVNRLFKGNIWYINHFCSICDSLSKGYIMEPTLVDALDRLLAIHEPRFTAWMNDLTTFQVRLLRAIVDGHTKFSSAAVIKQYGLNSSANVRRLKDALCKKELITFDEHDEPQFLDPVFEYWVRTRFFGLKDD